MIYCRIYILSLLVLTKGYMFSFASSSLPLITAVAPVCDFLTCSYISTETQTAVVSAQEMRAFHHPPC